MNGVNAMMLSHITGRTQHEEASKSSTTLDLVRCIRARRQQWVGHILRIEDENRYVKQDLLHIFENVQEGDMLMDAPKVESWQELIDLSRDRTRWR